ncbi:MAG: hypothetical protein R2911_18695 [Caldilineaceae bacterium]
MTNIHTLIHSARVVDGTGNPWFYADVALAGEQIAAIAPPNSIPHENAANVIDGRGLVLCPGFIDILSHSIIPLMADGRCLSKSNRASPPKLWAKGGRRRRKAAKSSWTLCGAQPRHTILTIGCQKCRAGAASATGWRP